MLFSPEAHEALADEPWSADTARAAIASIVADAESAFDDGWPLHPEDAEPDDDPATRFRTVYIGGAGVVDALHRLAQRGFVELRRDYLPYLERSLEAPPDFPDEDPERSLWMGETGIRLALQRLAPSQANLEQLAELIAANDRDERCELMWGSPGTILAGRELGLDVTPSIEWLRGQRDTDGLWTQQLAGKSTRYLGPAHGLAGCALALGDDAGVSETLRRLAVEEDGLVNWPPVAGLRLDATGDGLIRTQWCHGAPGIVATLGHVLDEDLALAGGELTWRAGPLRKGANLCHGTAGNGYAFLALLERTGDERWLTRARTFAMHAAGQVEHSRSDYGRGRYTLWTGDLGTALYLADCTDGGGELPLHRTIIRRVPECSAEPLDTHDAVVLGDHPSEFRWREPARVQPLQVCVGRPTGDGAALSDVDGNLVVEELLQELFRRRNADALDSLCLLARNELRRVAHQRDRALLPFNDGAVGRDVERNRRPGRVGHPSGCEVEDLDGVSLRPRAGRRKTRHRDHRRLWSPRRRCSHA